MPDNTSAPGSPPASPAPMGISSPPPRSRRLASLDALRGFDMFWIMGGDSIGHALSLVTGSAAAQFLATQLDHVAWAGFRFYDLIFPLFVFMVGASLAFSLSRIVTVEGRGAALRRLGRRTVLLYLLGLIYYGGMAKGWGDIRLLGVLQRLALCYGFAGLIFLYFGPRGRAVWTAALLVGYWALMTWVPVPGVGAGHFEEGRNLANYLDSRFLPLRKWDGTHDPEGLLSTLPAVASCLLGVWAGEWLRREGRPPVTRLRGLVLAGLACLAAGWTWSIWFPVVKKIWTSSFVLVAGGYSFLLLGLFYWVIDMRGWTRWAQPFLWVGSNAITIYFVSGLLHFDQLAQRLVGGEISSWLSANLGAGVGELVVSLMGITLCLALARFLYRRQLFLRL